MLWRYTLSLWFLFMWFHHYNYPLRATITTMRPVRKSWWTSPLTLTVCCTTCAVKQNKQNIGHHALTDSAVVSLTKGGSLTQFSYRHHWYHSCRSTYPAKCIRFESCSPRAVWLVLFGAFFASGVMLENPLDSEHTDNGEGCDCGDKASSCRGNVPSVSGMRAISYMPYFEFIDEQKCIYRGTLSYQLLFFFSLATLLVLALHCCANSYEQDSHAQMIECNVCVCPSWSRNEMNLLVKYDCNKKEFFSCINKRPQSLLRRKLGLLW